MKINVSSPRRVGYDHLLEKFGLVGMPNWHHSSVAYNSTNYMNTEDGVTSEVFQSQKWPGETDGEHLEFALKYDGVNLSLLYQIFEKISPEDLTKYIKTKPTGKYVRRIWFFYEFLTGERLPISDLKTGNYVYALEDSDYYTIQPGEKSSRHRVVDNLLGPKEFCPIIRRTEKLINFDSVDIAQKCAEVVDEYPPELLSRAMNYLYHKETKSSFEIEHITPDMYRTQRFITALELAEKEDFCEKEKLIELQNRIVDPRFKNGDYRVNQNYVGQTVTHLKEIIYFICPKPEDLPDLMLGLLRSHNRMKVGNISPVIHAAAIAYGFVFLHPFEDGNGRIHRFLIHNILSLQNAVPAKLMFPVSAVMLKNPKEYDRSLEAFSRPLLNLIKYNLDQLGKMSVDNDTAVWYRYIDMTYQAESLYEFVIKTIEEELVAELTFLKNYDKTKKAIQNIIDMPDRLIDLFIRLCLQNDGHLSVKKRTAYFDFLTDEELIALEQTIKSLV